MSETVALTQGLQGLIRPGTVIAGKYRLEEEIGKGSMGTVYRAVHVTLGQRVAIKLISSEHSQSLEARKRFSVEAKAAAKLRSRHVVQVYDDGETPEGNPYIVLEYLEGETLEQRLDREHDIPLADAVRIAGHVGRALARAHAQGIVHRDLKPANIFLVKSDDDELGWLAKVLDFGIAKLDSVAEKGTTQAGTVLGDPPSMSPEQVRGASSVDHRADLNSLGMCLYHMLTGDFAFYSPNYSDILISICTQPLPLLRSQAPWVPEAVEQWFQRACAREPLERFQSADEMTEALSAAAGTPPRSQHKSFPEGRIAPETLVGYAAPAITSLGPDTSPMSMARTQLLLGPGSAAAPGPDATGTSPGHASPLPSGGRPGPPIPIVISSDRAASGSDWQPPPRNLKPFVIGLCLGFLALSTVALTLMTLTRSKDDDLPPAAARPAATPSASPPPIAAPLAPQAPPAAPATLQPAVQDVAGSSVAAEGPPAKPAKPATTGPKGKLHRSPSKSAGGSAPALPAPREPKAAPGKPPSSDLGF